MLKPWREVAVPHEDVLKGTFQQAEFAADLSRVHDGTATDEYQKPTLFFQRTFVTEGMSLLLDSVVKRLTGCRAEGGRIVAVGTTSARTLETAAMVGNGCLVPWSGQTDIFIRPGHQFKAVDVLLTNFHLPRSSLLVLVSAFAGRELILEAYRIAIEQQYRFYSYGDCMLIV